MRIWIVNPHALPPSNFGGTRHFAMSRHLVRMGHEVYIVAGNIHYASHTRMAEHSGVQRVDGVTFVWIEAPNYRTNSVNRLWNHLVFTFNLLYGRQVRELPAPDVIIGSSPHPFAAWAAERIASRLGVPFVMEVRDLWPQSLIDLGAVSAHHPFVVGLQRLERYLYRRASKIITLMPRAVHYLASLGIPFEKNVWLPNGIDLGALSDPPAPVASDLFTVLYTGAHGMANGLDILLEAARLLLADADGCMACLVLIGDGPEKVRLIQKAHAMGLTNVAFEPPIPKQEIFGRLQQADAFVFTLRKSPVFKWGLSPNKLFDYLAMARPIIFAADTVDNPVEAAGAGITTDPESPEAVAGAIKALIKMNAEERRAMGLRGRRYVEEHHSMARLAARLESVLREVTEASHAIAPSQAQR